MAATAILNLSTRCWERPETCSTKLREPCTKVCRSTAMDTKEYKNSLAKAAYCTIAPEENVSDADLSGVWLKASLGCEHWLFQLRPTSIPHFTFTIYFNTAGGRD